MTLEQGTCEHCFNWGELIVLDGAYLCPSCADWLDTPVLRGSLVDHALSELIQRIVLLICFSVCIHRYSSEKRRFQWENREVVGQRKLYLSAKYLSSEESSASCDTQSFKQAFDHAITSLKGKKLIEECTVARSLNPGSASTIRRAFSLTRTGLGTVVNVLIPNLTLRERLYLTTLRRCGFILRSYTLKARILTNLLDEKLWSVHGRSPTNPGKQTSTVRSIAKLQIPKKISAPAGTPERCDVGGR
jgi:hypothetical protein